MRGLNWTKEEDEKLVHFYKFHNGKWGLICEEMPGRNKEGCRKRLSRHHPNLFPSNPHPGRKDMERNYPWTHNEERVLIALEHNKSPLSDFTLCLPDRTICSCHRDQWQLNRSMAKSSGPSWTSQEDQTLVEQRKAKKSWGDISTAFRGAHSLMDCRTRWFDKYWEEFNNSVVDGDFDLQKYIDEVRQRPGANEVCDDECDSEDDAEGDTDYEEDQS